MSFYFPEPYEDEILYSLISRYHYYSGNKNAKTTLKELFGTKTIVPTVELTSNLKSFCKLIGYNKIYSEDNFINRHTSLPFHFPFLDLKKRLAIKQSMINEKGNGMYARIGIVAGGICIKKELYYCPKCVSEDIKTLGEAYFHRIHQIPGVIVCPTHECLVKQYSVTRNDIGRIKYIRLDPKCIDSNTTYIENNLINGHLIKIARCVRYILNNDLSKFNQEVIKERYKYILADKGLLTSKKRIRQDKLIKLLKEYYPEELLRMLESVVDTKESNWIKMINRKCKRSIHPIRHIMFILFLCNDAESFFNDCNCDNQQFNGGLWPCLNPAANHYREFVVNKCKITSDYKTRQQVATFQCDCGFVYSRKMAKDEPDDAYKIGRIKKYGEVWEMKLLQLINDKEHSLRALGRIMKSDPKTIVKYARKLGIENIINSKMKIVENEPKIKNTNYREQYSKDILQLTKQHPEYTRNQLRKVLNKQYMWFYRNDRKWFNKNLPVVEKHKSNGVNERVDWYRRDIETCENVKSTYRNLLNAEKPIRITKSIIGHKLGISALLDHYLDKLVMTKKYLNEISETIEDFQIRRVNIICFNMLERNLGLKEWKILKAAGLNNNCSERVKIKINEYIQISH